MALATYGCRVFAFTVMQRPIRNQFLQSFLYYVPYVTLAVMTFPAILQATQAPVAGLAAFCAGILCAYLGGNLFLVAGVSCISVFVLECFL
ncbi:MAG: AzlD domain-containing protein [Eubacterium sp.]|jgi:branched-subunit amino acid transport protein|nr:AzlD domain-containing protein [Eubacterium sp.]